MEISETEWQDTQTKITELTNRVNILESSPPKPATQENFPDNWEQPKTIPLYNLDEIYQQGEFSSIAFPDEQQLTVQGVESNVNDNGGTEFTANGTGNHYFEEPSDDEW